jgi:ppGpp synthetase/RelA/SpoT-type nucleotidyltranferase
MEDLEHARRRWLSEEPQYRVFGVLLQERLQKLIRRLGIPGEVKARTKEVDSLIKKLIQQPDKTYVELGDKLGVRVVVKRLNDVDVVRDEVAREFDCGEFEDKADKLAEDRVGYLSVHVDISLWSNDHRFCEFPSNQFRAELQIRTLAQNLWSEMSHDTSYKSGPVLRPKLKRRLHLLAAIIEVADNDYQSVENEFSRLPDYPEHQVLRSLERQYYKLSSRRGDTELSLRVIRLLWPLYGKTPEQLSEHFSQVFAEHKDILTDVLEQAELSAADRSAFMFQPEVIMIFDQLSSMEYQLRPAWSREFPDAELERIATRFGISFD